MVRGREQEGDGEKMTDGKRVKGEGVGNVRNREEAGKHQDRHPVCTDLLICGSNNQASSFKRG